MLLIEISRGQQTLQYVTFMDNTLVGPKLRAKMEILGDALFRLGFTWHDQGHFDKFDESGKLIAMVYPFNGGPTITVVLPTPDRGWLHNRRPYSTEVPRDLSFDDVKNWISDEAA